MFPTIAKPVSSGRTFGIPASCAKTKARHVPGVPRVDETAAVLCIDRSKKNARVAAESDEAAVEAPVRDEAARMAAVRMFAERYNALQDTLSNAAAQQTEWDGGGACRKTFESLRKAVYHTVELDPMRGKRISLYEIGVAHSPDSITAGRLSIDDGKLAAAISARVRDVRALFTNEDDGLLVRLSGLLSLLSELTADCAHADKPSFEEVCERGDLFIEACGQLWAVLTDE